MTTLKYALLASALALSVAAPGAHADAYPSKPIRLVVPYPPGGPVDFVARAVSTKLGAELGQTIVIDNKPGAGGNIGAADVARAEPDGYTFLVVYDSHAVANLFYKDLKFDAFNSFDYISLIGYSPLVLVTSKASGLDTLPKFISAAKANPGKFNQAITGYAGNSTLKVEQLKQATGIKTTTVPYGGAAAALSAIAGGQVDVLMASMPVVLSLVKGDKMNALAVGTKSRSPLLPEIPVLSDTVPGFEAGAWVGLVGPKGLPPAVEAKIGDAMRASLKDAQVKRILDEGGFVSLGTDSKQFVERARADYRDTQKMISDLNLKIE